jgi:serine O-acetyltransferase
VVTTFDFGYMAFMSAGDYLIESIRAYQHYRAKRGLIGTLLKKIMWARYRFWTIVTATDIDPRTRIGKRLRIPHPSGIVTHFRSTIGDDCLIMQGVTLGRVAEPDEGPKIGNNVFIGAGAKILGPVQVGDGARIGANAVVLQDVPPGCTAVGVPARIVAQEAASPASVPNAADGSPHYRRRHMSN